MKKIIILSLVASMSLLGNEIDSEVGDKIYLEPNEKGISIVDLGSDKVQFEISNNNNISIQEVVCTRGNTGYTLSVNNDKTRKTYEYDTCSKKTTIIEPLKGALETIESVAAVMDEWVTGTYGNNYERFTVDGEEGVATGYDSQPLFTIFGTWNNQEVISNKFALILDLDGDNISDTKLKRLSHNLGKIKAELAEGTRTFFVPTGNQCYKLYTVEDKNLDTSRTWAKERYLDNYSWKGYTEYAVYNSCPESGESQAQLVKN